MACPSGVGARPAAFRRAAGPLAGGATLGQDRRMPNAIASARNAPAVIVATVCSGCVPMAARGTNRNSRAPLPQAGD